MDDTRRLRQGSQLALVLFGALAGGMAWAEQGADPHAMHDHASGSGVIQHSVSLVKVPPVRMVRADGEQVWLDKELNDGRPVVMNFVFTSCTTICPLGSQELSRLQDRLGNDAGAVHLVSISIDPEQDTPARLRAYSKHFNAGGAWQYYTGTSAASAQVQKSFGVYRGGKMSHAPVTLIYAGSGNSWVKLDGFATVDDLYSELKSLQAIP